MTSLAIAVAALAVSGVFIAQALVDSGALSGKLYLFKLVTTLDWKTASYIAGGAGGAALLTLTVSAVFIKRCRLEFQLPNLMKYLYNFLNNQTQFPQGEKLAAELQSFDEWITHTYTNNYSLPAHLRTMSKGTAFACFKKVDALLEQNSNKTLT